MSAAKVLPLAWADWCAEARLSACAVLGLAAVLAPLLEKALAPVGIRFQKPEPRTAVESGALARPGLN